MSFCFFCYIIPSAFYDGNDCNNGRFFFCCAIKSPHKQHGMEGFVKERKTYQDTRRKLTEEKITYCEEISNDFLQFRKEIWISETNEQINSRVSKGYKHLCTTNDLSNMLTHVSEVDAYSLGNELSPLYFAKSTKTIASICLSLPNTFGDTLIAHMKRTGMTVEELAERSLMSSRQIARYRATPEPKISLPSVICLCVGLKLHPLLSFDLVEKAGYVLINTMEHTAYKLILTSMTTRSVHECNRCLKQLGIRPIGRE